METRAKVADHKMCCLYQPNSAQTFPHWQNEGLRICRVVHITISQEATPAQGWAGPDDATSVWAPTAAPVAQLKGHPGLLRFFFQIGLPVDVARVQVTGLLLQKCQPAECGVEHEVSGWRVVALQFRAAAACCRVSI